MALGFQLDSFNSKSPALWPPPCWREVGNLGAWTGRHGIEPPHPPVTPSGARLLSCWDWEFATGDATIDLCCSLHVASAFYVLLFPHMVLKSTSLTVRASRCGEAIPEEIDHWQMSEHTWFLEASQGAAFSHRNSGTPATRGKRLSIFVGCFWRNQS